MKWLMPLLLVPLLAGCVAEERLVPEYAVDGVSFAGGQWIGSEPLTHEGLKGKVLIVDFWTYSCINCIRTFPHITALYDTYEPYGLVVVGVHSPEFDFEKERGLVIGAMDENGINYPVVQDNDFAIWKSYENRYWPAHYVYDAQGALRDTHFGEGAYKETEELVRQLLTENGVRNLPSAIEGEPGTPIGGGEITRELYAGYWRQPEALGQGTDRGETKTYTIPDAPSKHQIYLEGTWFIGEEAIRAETDGIVQLTFRAGSANFVIDGEGCIGVTLDGSSVPPENRPYDGDCIELTGPDSYDFYGGAVEEHTVQFSVPAGFELYTFAFGGNEAFT